jgi:hypothetical protein
MAVWAKLRAFCVYKKSMFLKIKKHFFLLQIVANGMDIEMMKA